METAIGYLNTVHEDLLDAAHRERRAGRPRSPRRPPSALIAAAAAVVLLAGVIGAIVRSGGIGSFGSDEAGKATAPVGGSTGAAGEVPGERAPAPISDANTVGTAGFLDESQRFGIPHPEGAQGVFAGQTSAEIARVIRTAELGLVIPRDSFDDRFGEATDVAEANDGFVAESTARERAGNLTIRVPADRFGRTLAALRGLGEVDIQSVRGQDVTAEYVDLQARLRIARARREVLLDLMREAVSIEQTIRVQNALDDTQLRIEEIQGQIRLLDDRTSLATIHVALREEGVEPRVEVDTPSLPTAFERSVAGFVGVIGAIVIGIGYLLPPLVIGLAGWFVATRVRRRREAS